MQDKNKKQQKKNIKNTSSEFDTFALAGGKKDLKSGTTIPSAEGVSAAKEFVTENKK